MCLMLCWTVFLLMLVVDIELESLREIHLPGDCLDIVSKVISPGDLFSN